jgi:tetratricopeptide (TPR) repeat protein
MKTESIVFAIAGMCFGLILGWVIAVQQGAGSATSAAATQPAAQAGQNGAPVLDEARVQALTTILQSDPGNAEAAVQLANTYFDGQRFQDAINWYEQALKLQPTNADVSTDLGISYYYTGQVDRALQQFDASLKLDPRHVKTILNQGVVLAFGKEDLSGAAEKWKQVVALSPNSPEAQAAQRALDGIAAAGHPAGATAAPGS